MKVDTKILKQKYVLHVYFDNRRGNLRMLAK